MSAPLRHPLSILLVTLSCAGPPLVARAQDPAQEAADRFKSGLADMEAGRYETGCKALAESQRLDPRPGTLFTLATCEDRWGHSATALKRYEEYLALYERLSDALRAKQGERPSIAKTQRDKLALAAPELTLVLPKEAPPGTVVTWDGRVMSAAALGVAMREDPGEHTVAAKAPGGPRWEQKVTLNPGEKKTLTVEVRPPPAVEQKPPSAEQKPPPPLAPNDMPRPNALSSRRIAAYGIGGAGLAGVLVGSVLGGLTLGKKGVIRDHCGAAIQSNDETACDQTGLDAANAAKPLGLGSTIGFIMGLTFVTTAVVLIATEPKRTQPTSSRAQLSISMGPLGAVAEGTW